MINTAFNCVVKSLVAQHMAYYSHHSKWLANADTMAKSKWKIDIWTRSKEINERKFNQLMHIYIYIYMYVLYTSNFVCTV